MRAMGKCSKILMLLFSSMTLDGKNHEKKYKDLNVNFYFASLTFVFLRQIAKLGKPWSPSKMAVLQKLLHSTHVLAKLSLR